MKITLLWIFSLAIFTHSLAQNNFTISNLMEYQVGNLPFTEPTNLTTLYDQLNLRYRQGVLSAHVKFERFQQVDDRKSYAKVAQRSIRLRQGNFDLTVGHFNEIIGRGLLLRSYEIPGAILEDTGFRVRYGFYRDIDGISIKYQPKFMEIKALRGRPLFNAFPPIFEAPLRRPNLVEAVEINLFAVENWNFGGAYLRNNVNEDFQEYGMGSITGNLPFNVQIYSEYAQRMGRGNRFLDLSDKSSHAWYNSLSYVNGPVGLSFEYKDYHNFILTPNEAFNDPPPLVKEHPYVLLNRSTHVLNAADETGWQAEIFLTSRQGHTLTLNMTEAENKTAIGKRLFQEKFAEVSILVDDQTSLKSFVDFSEEPFKLEVDRFTTGVYVERAFAQSWGTVLDLEYQQFTRDFSDAPEKAKNFFAALTISKSPNFSTGIVWERTTDPGLTDNPTTPDMRETNPRHWLGVNVGYQYNYHHFINIFYGKRRGGLACTSGICYEILDFEGFELRLTSTF